MRNFRFFPKWAHKISARIFPVLLLAFLPGILPEPFEANAQTEKAQAAQSNAHFIIQAEQELDGNFLSGEIPDWSTNAFTVAMRFRALAPGKVPTSGNGMLFVSGSGWFDGFRAYYDYSKDFRIHFQIGRAKERRGVEAVSQFGPPFSLLNDLVCTYDGKTLRLYLNGKLEAETEFTDGLSPNSSKLQIGNACFGVGSVKMYVENLEYWNHAKDAAFVTKRFASFPKQEQERLELWKNFHFTDKLDNFDYSLEQLEKMVLVPGTPYALHENLLNRYVAEQNWSKGLPFMTDLTRRMMNTEIPADETLEQENQRLSNLCTLFLAWEKVPEKVLKEADSGETANIKTQFLAQFAKERALLEKIRLLESQMYARTEALERQTIQNREKLCTMAQKATRKFWIAPNGLDENPGTEQAPFQSLKKALESASALQKSGQSVEILVMDGTYACTETAEILNEAANPNLKAAIYVHPAPNSKPVFTFGQELRGFTEVKDPEILERLPESSRGLVLTASLSQNGITDFGSFGKRGYQVHDQMPPWTDLYLNGKPLEMARFPNAGEEDLPIGEVVPGPGATDKDPKSGTFHCANPRVKSWKWEENAKDTDIWAYGLWFREYASHTAAILDFDPETEKLTVDANTNGRFTFRFLNVLEELDQPGEFYLDRKNGRVYFIPPKGTDLSNAKIDFPRTDSLFLNLRGAQNLIFEGLTFLCTRGTAVWMENCESVLLNRCRIAQCGIHALVMNHGHDCGIYDSKIEFVGSCGVRAAGGNRETLEPCRHFVSNCLIHDFCRIDRSYAPAVHAKGVGMVLTNNLIYESPHHAFRTEGNDLLIARNEVHSVVYDFSDQSGIDIYCDPTYRGIVIRDNFWHHIGSKLALCGQAGIRLDDSISGTVMTGNVFYRSAGGFFGGIQVHGGKDNLIRKNLFADCKTGVSFQPWFNGRYRDTFLIKVFPKLIKPYQEMEVYPFMDEIEEHINRNYVFENDFVRCGRFTNSKASLSRIQICAGNRSFSPKSELPVRENGLSTPQELRAWLEKIPGYSLPEIGIQPSPNFPNGQADIEHDISPNYWTE